MRTRTWLLAALLVVAAAGPACPTALRITPADTDRLFGGTDAEGGIGDWYVSNGVVEAIIDDAGVAGDLVGVVPPGSEPPIQSEIAFTGGTVIDLGRVGANDDQLTQMFTVGGLSTSNFLVYSTVSAPTADTVRAAGKVLFPPVSVQPAPCLDVVTDYTAAGSDPFLTVTSTVTNGCGTALAGFGGLLDVFIWTLRSIIPFSGGGAPPVGGRGFDHVPLDLASPAAALELPVFMAGPGVVGPGDGVVDTASGTTCGEVAYGLLGVEVQVDPDGPGPTAPAVTPANTLFGISSSLVTALGNTPAAASLPAGATLTYARRLYAGARNDVRSVADDIYAELAGRLGFATGTISGNVDAADTADVEASILATRVGRCAGNPSLACKAAADCGGAGACADPLPAVAQAVGGVVSHVRTDATGAFSGVVLPQGDYELRTSSAERDDVVVSPVVVRAGDTPVAIPALAARGTVAFTVQEKTRGLPAVPAKLTFKGVAPTSDPRFKKDLSVLLGGEDILPETFGGTQAGTSGHAAGQGNVVYTATGAEPSRCGPAPTTSTPRAASSTPWP
jgi:hypothetical protein